MSCRSRYHGSEDTQIVGQYDNYYSTVGALGDTIYVKPHPVVACPDGEPYTVPVAFEHVVIHVQIEGLQNCQPRVAIAVYMISSHDSVIRATVQKQPRFNAIRDVVVRDRDVVAPFRGNNTVVT